MFINARHLAFRMYRTNEGPKPYYLQRVLVHELAGHGSDASLTPEKVLSERKEALEKALNRLFRYFPSLEERYKTTGRICEKDVRALRSVSDYRTFDDMYKNILEGNNLKVDLSRLDRGDLSEFNVLRIALNTLYQGEMNDITNERHETPVIEMENLIMKKYYGETADRIGHLAVSVRDTSDINAPPPRLLYYPDMVSQTAPVIRR
jgi:hypothetical protein